MAFRGRLWLNRKLLKCSFDTVNSSSKNPLRPPKCNVHDLRRRPGADRTNEPDRSTYITMHYHSGRSLVSGLLNMAIDLSRNRQSNWTNRPAMMSVHPAVASAVDRGVDLQKELHWRRLLLLLFVPPHRSGLPLFSARVQ